RASGGRQRRRPRPRPSQRNPSKAWDREAPTLFSCHLDRSAQREETCHLDRSAQRGVERSQHWSLAGSATTPDRPSKSHHNCVISTEASRLCDAQWRDLLFGSGTIPTAQRPPTLYLPKRPTQDAKIHHEPLCARLSAAAHHPGTNISGCNTPQRDRDLRAPHRPRRLNSKADGVASRQRGPAHLRTRHYG